jgi:U4/U6.U5 tri-snRNP-associated protein 2
MEKDKMDDEDNRDAVKADNDMDKVKADNDMDEDEDWKEWRAAKKRARLEGGAASSKGLFLETINRSRLDFDFERVCSVSLSNLNVYACLVCGKYFQG